MDCIPILKAFWLKNRLRGFGGGLRVIQDPPLTTPKGVLTGPHTVVQWSGGPGTRDWGLVLGILHAVGLVARRIVPTISLPNIIIPNIILPNSIRLKT